MGLLGIDSKSSSKNYQYDQRVAAADESQVLRAAKDALSARDNAKATNTKVSGSKNVINDSGTVLQLTSTVGAGANTGVKMGNIGTGNTITIGDGGEMAEKLAGTIDTLTRDTTAALQSALDGQSGVVQEALDSQRSALQQALSGVADTVSTSLGKLGELSLSKQTDGASETNKTLLWIVLGLGGLALAAFALKK